MNYIHSMYLLVMIFSIISASFAQAQGIERTAALPTQDASAQLMMSLSNRVSNLDAQNRLQFDSLNAQLREIRTLLSASTTTVVTTTTPARISGTAATSPSVPVLTTTTISQLLPTCQPGQVVAMAANRTLTCTTLAQLLPQCQPNQAIVFDAARNPACAVISAQTVHQPVQTRNCGVGFNNPCFEDYLLQIHRTSNAPN